MYRVRHQKNEGRELARGETDKDDGEESAGLKTRRYGKKARGGGPASTDESAAEARLEHANDRVLPRDDLRLPNEHDGHHAHGENA